MDNETRKKLYLNQIRVTGQVILSRQNAEWFLAQLKPPSNLLVDRRPVLIRIVAPR
jgi:hypothetical protein